MLLAMAWRCGEVPRQFAEDYSVSIIMKPCAVPSIFRVGVRPFAGLALGSLLLLLGGVPGRAFAGVTFTNIFLFGGTNGSDPQGKLVQARDGYLYGVTESGGANNDGVFYRIGLDGTFTQLASFTDDIGSSPNDIVEGADGNFYGTSFYGGPNGRYADGTVFKATPDGQLTRIVAFGGTNGLTPRMGLVAASDGNLYGGAAGGTNWGFSPNSGGGVIFRVATNGSFTVLAQLDSRAEQGFNPQTQLMQARDGLLYGTTWYGGSFITGIGFGAGTVFRMTLDGQIAFLGSCDGTNANAAFFPLVQAPDGTFYGTSYGGVNQLGYGSGLGNVFRVGMDGSISNLFSFSGTNGCYPRGSILCSDGNLYGMAGSGGSAALPPAYSGSGNIFKLSPDGVFTVLVPFDSGTGGSPWCNLMQASDGNLYGVNQTSPGGQGAVFRLSLPLPANFKRIARTNNTVELTWSASASQVYQAQYRTNATTGEWLNLGGTVTATNGIMTTVDTIGADSCRFYRIAVLP
jgi:uncharacterized repeat protein (TIGR03803 family)